MPVFIKIIYTVSYTWGTQRQVDHLTAVGVDGSVTLKSVLGK